VIPANPSPGGYLELLSRGGRLRHRVRLGLGRPLRVVHLTDLHLGWGTPDHLISQTLALTQGVEPMASMFAQDLVRALESDLPFFFPQTLAHEIRKPDSPQKTNTLAVRAIPGR
jgi:hypothetical protein